MTYKKRDTEGIGQILLQDMYMQIVLMLCQCTGFCGGSWMVNNVHNSRKRRELNDWLKFMEHFILKQ